MNERIKELADQAGIYKLRMSDELVLAETEYWVMEKFAELIVAKCVAQCEFVAGQAEFSNKGEMARKTKATADYCAFFIKEYFGVEE
jgi:hypothetical protein